MLTNSSITLHWEVPDGPNPHNYTYWVQWTGDGDKTETQNTTIISYAVEGLKSVSSYEFSVWVKKDGIPGSRETLESFIGRKCPRPLADLFLLFGMVGSRRRLGSYRRRCQQMAANMS